MQVMNIGLDYDGVIADTNKVKSEWLKQTFGINIPAHLTNRTSCIRELAKYFPKEKSVEIYDNFQTFIYGGEYARNAPEIPGAVDLIKRLSGKHSLWIVTARYDPLMQDAKDYLIARNILSCFKGIESAGNVDPTLGRPPTKEEICLKRRISVLVDDDERHLVNVNVQGLKKILLRNGGDDSEHVDGVSIARSMKDVEEYIQNMTCQS